MAAKVLVLYNPTSDGESFEKYYYSTHVPLVRKVQGLRSYTTSNGPVMGPDGKPMYQLVAELEFDSMADLQAGLGSPEGKATADDLPNFVKDGVSVAVYETRDA